MPIAYLLKGKKEQQGDSTMTDLKLIEFTGWSHHAGWSWQTDDTFEGYHVQHFRVSRHQHEKASGSSRGMSELCAAYKPTKCDRCGCDYKGEELSEHLGKEPIYDTTDGTSKRPGDMWYADSYMTYDGFQNPDLKHLMIRCPGGGVWDSDSRAANCTKPEDVTHRCWVKHAENGVENLTVDKNGETCNAGGGSILKDNWHGFIENGCFRKA